MKKSKVLFYRLIVLFFIFVQLLLIMPNINVNKMNVNAVENDISNIGMAPIISAPTVSLVDSITVRYEDINSIQFDLEYEFNGINAVLIENEEYLELEIFGLEEEFGELKVSAIDNDSIVYSNTLYTYNSGNKLHISEFSRDHALYLGLKDMYESNTDDSVTITEAECVERYAALTGEYIECNNIIDWILEGTVTSVTGTIYWETSDTPTPGTTTNPILPLRNAEIQVGIKVLGEFVPLESGYTDDKGEYNIEIDHSGVLDGSDLYIRVKLNAHTFFIATDWFFDHYFYEAKLAQKDFEAGSTISKNHTIKYESSTWLYKATCVHQAMVIGERFAEKMGYETSRIVRVAYPGGILGKIDEELKNQGFCGGNIFNSSYSVIGIDSYNDVDTIIHEYSHYVQMSMGNYDANLAEIIYWGPEHDGEKDEYYEKKNKKYAMHLVWTEAWGYAFSAMAQKYFIGQYNTMENYNGYLYIIDHYSGVSNYLGEFQEASVGRFLWSLFDDTQPKEKYNFIFPLTYQEWWDMTTVQGTYRLPDFINLIENESYNLGVDLDYEQINEYIAEKLTLYNIAPEIMTMDLNTAKTQFVIRWIANGSDSVNDGEYYSNNRFIVKIFNENKEEIYSSDELSRHVTNASACSYYIDIDTWNNLLHTEGWNSTVYVSIVAYRYDEDADEIVQKSGPYYSSFVPIKLNHTYRCETTGTTHSYICNDCGYTETKPHNLQYSNITSTHHTYGCTDCNYSVTSEHDMYLSMSVESGKHGYKCHDCGYVDESTVGTHSYDYWIYVDNTTHRSECGCGARGDVIAPHAFVPVKGSLLKVVCVDCGYTKRKDSDFGNVIMSITKVSINGSYILPDGTIMLVDEDIEAYLNGTLVFYDKSNVPQTQ